MADTQQDIFDQVAPSTPGGADIFDQVAGPQAPKNPYADANDQFLGDMSKVAGATPGMQSPMQAAASRPVQPVEKQDIFDAIVGNGDAPITAAQQEFEQRQNDAAARTITGGDPALASQEKTLSQYFGQQQENPVESAVRSIPVAGDVAAGGYHALRGTSGLAEDAELLPGSSGVPKGRAGLDQTLKHATEAIGGAMDVTMPAFGVAGMMSPVKTAATYFTAIAAGHGAQEVAKKLGMSPVEQNFANVVGTFIPIAFHTVTQLDAQFGDQTARVRDAEGNIKEVPVKTAAVGGRGFGFGVGKGEDGSVYAAGRVGPFSARAKWGGSPEGAPPPAAGQPARTTGPVRGLLPAEGVDPTANLGVPHNPAPPDPVEMLANDRADAIQGAAIRAAETQAKAEDVAAGVTPPEIPKPHGMDQGVVTPETAGMMARVINMLPEHLKPQGILETVGNLAKWMFGRKTIIGPDGKVVSVDTPEAAQKNAVRLVNDQIERQNQSNQEAAEQQKEDAETAQTEREEALQPTKEAAPKPQTEIPDNPHTQLARRILGSLPDNTPAAKMDQALRDKILLPTPIRKALVDEEVTRRASEQEAHANEALTGQPTPEGQKPHEIDKWVKAVKDGEEPFAHVQKSTTHRPQDTEGLSRTTVKGAKDADGIYYHDPEVSSADIRNAARKGTLDQLRENWKNGKSAAQPGTEAGGSPAPAAQQEESQAQPETVPTAPQHELTPFEGTEGKRTNVLLADGSSIPARHRMVELSSLNPSHNGMTFAPSPAYPPGVQERSYDKSKDEQNKVIQHEQNFEPSYIVNTNPDATNGAPIVTSKPVTIDGVTYPAGTVLGGNSRAMTLQRVYTNGAEAAYKEALLENHRSFGFPPEVLEQFNQPVHVREIEPPQTLEEMHRLGSLLNKPPTQSLDQFDQAVSIGKHLSPDTLNGIAEIIRNASDHDSTATLNAVLSDKTSGRQIVRMLESDGIITDTNRMQFIDPSMALLTTAARSVLGNALLANLLDSRELMEKTPAILKQKLLGSIGSISAITATDDGWNLGPAMKEAAKQYGELARMPHATVAEAMQQGGMFGGERGPVVDAIIRSYDKNINEVRRSFSMFTNGAMEGRNPSGYLVGLTETPEPYQDFNFAFGTELTKEQFDQEMKKLRGGEEAPTEGVTQTAPATEDHSSHSLATSKTSDEEKPAPQGELLPPAAQPEIRPFQKNDKVTYTTNAGKQRAGTVAFADDRIVRIRDARTGTVITKKKADVKHADHWQNPPASMDATEKPEVKPVPEEPKQLEAPAEEEKNLADHLFGVINSGGGPKDYNALKRIVEEFDGKEPDQLRMKVAQEAYEAATVKASQNLAALAKVVGPKQVFGTLVERYESQPNLAIRTSTSIANQAYSTPAPLAFIAGKFAGLAPGKTGYDPTGGNGMLGIDAGISPKDRASFHANEIEPTRIANLRWQGHTVTTNDASKWSPSQQFDSVVTNPPFGNLPEPVKFDGYEINTLEHLIALKALSAMKDDGTASIIIGASKEPGEVAAKNKPFFNYLYSHYNVIADFELDGDMYSRQGASWPVRVLAVDGRARSAKVIPPASAIERLTTWEQVYEQAVQHLGANLEGRRRADTELAGEVRGEGAGSESIPATAGGSGSNAGVGGQETSPEGYTGNIGSGQPGPIVHTGGVPTAGVGSPDNVVASDGDVASSDRLAEDQPRAKAVRREPALARGHSSDAAIADEGNQFQAPYTPFSEKKDVNILAPRAMVGAMQRAMESLSEQIGDLDQFVTDELGYSSIEEMQKAFMGLQVDTVAAALHGIITRGTGIIIADQTGVGKGRQAAAIIRWAELHGHIPIFMSAKKNLFTDMYGDLNDIGSGNAINPLLMNADAEITHPVTGQKVFGNKQSEHSSVMQRILETGEMPAGRNALFSTYSQINKPNRQQLVLQRLAPKAIFILDESHKAGGDSATGVYMRGLLDSARGVTYLSATYAKRPDNLPLYAAKTDIGLAIPDKERIVSAIEAGGAPLQSVMSYQLAQSGQLFRRERSFDGISFPTHIAENRKAEHEQIADRVTEVLRAIVEADAIYHEIDFGQIQADAIEEGGSAEMGGNNASGTVQHMEFTSIVHNLTKQMLLGLKADDIADKVIEDIKNDKKPIIALENTMGSFLDSYAETHGLLGGAPLHNLTYSTVLQRALDRTRYYNKTDKQGRKTRVEVPLSDLSEGTQEVYEQAQALIRSLKANIPVSPIDWIRNRVENAGFRIAEITGRNLRVDYSRDVPTLSTVPSIERKDRVATGLGFNNGGIDALILNQAGSTGISLHASEKFKDQRTRKMYVVQPAGDINEFMQMLGRINRTGQVKLPEYEMFAVALPAETRPAMMLSRKMKSLNANTSSNTRSSVSVDSPDMMNKYGDKVVTQYLAENHDMARALRMNVQDDDDGDAGDDVARKATGRSALLPVAQQKEFLDAVAEQYSDLIKYLDDTGQNDLEPRTYDFDARERGGLIRIYQGVDPSSPFGQDAHYGEYSIKRQGKPFTPDEVREMVQDGLNGGRNAIDRHREIIAQMEPAFKDFIARQSSVAVTDRARQVRDTMNGFLSTHRVGSGSRVEINGETYNAVVTSIEPAKKPTGNPYAASAIKFSLALNGPIRGIMISGSEFQKILVTPLGASADIRNLFHDYNPDSRMTAKIITGNLLGAYGNLKGNVRGRIINFTMADGSNQIGILMPAKFDPKEHVAGDYCMRTAEGALKVVRNHQGQGAPVSAPSGDVQVVKNGQGVSIKTKLAKSVGGKFYKDKNLLAHIQQGEFFSRNGMMVGDVIPGHELDAIRAVMGKAALYSTSSMIDRAREYDAESKPAEQKPSLASKLMSEEGSVDVDAAAEYIQKAVPATWNEITKAVQASGMSAKKIGYEFMAAFSPNSLADEDAKDIMGKGTGEPKLRMFQAAQLLRGVQKMFEGMTPEKQVEFVDRWQGGRKQPSTDLQNAQDLMQTILAEQRVRENEAFNLGRDEDDQRELSDKENYFPNRYKKGPSNELIPTEEQRIIRLFSRRPFEGSKAFLKEQRYTLKEAVAKGAEPLGTPVDMLMQRLQEGAKFVAAKTAWHDFKESGIASFVRNGKKVREDYVRINDKSSQVFRRIVSEDGNEAFLKTGEWTVQRDAGRLLNNYLSVDHIRGSEIGTSLVNLKNLSTEMKLALSPFHFGYITVETFASALNTGLDRFYNQGVRNLSPEKMAAGLEDIGKAILAPYTAVKQGGQMLKFAEKPDQFLASPEGQRFAKLYPDYPRLQQLLFYGGLRWGMADTFRTSWGDGFEQAMKNGELGKGFLKAAPYVAHLLMKPLFEHYIPRAKWVFAVQMLSQKLSQYSQAIASGAMTEEQIAREVAATADNRFGEFNWDSLYLDNTLRTAMQLAFRSATWKIGSWRGLVQAGKEQFTSKAFDDRIFERIDQQADQFEWLRDKTRRLPQLGMNAGWILSMGITVAVVGSILEKLASHRWPWEWAKDDSNGLPKWASAALEAMHPRTGAHDDRGMPVRISFPTGLKDYEHGFTEPGRYAKGSMSDVAANFWDTLDNRDAFGNYVYNPDDPAIKEFEQGLAYNLKGDFLPMSASNYGRQFGAQDVPSKLGRATGMIGGAPKFLDQSSATRHALEFRHHEPHTPEQEEAYQLAQHQPPTRYQVLRAAREKDMTYLDKVVLHDLTYSQAKEIYDKYATPQEQQQLRPVLERKRTLEIMKARRQGRMF